MAKKLSHEPTGNDAAPQNPKKPNPPRPRKKPPKSKKPDQNRESLPPEISSSNPTTPTAAPKKPPKPEVETRKWFMYPQLRQNIVDAVSTSIPAPRYQKKNTDRDRTEYYETYVMGRFQCKNSACATSGWGSKKVSIVIKGFSENRYNAVVYNQRCRSCNSLGTLTLDETSYVERVAYRLKKWAGAQVETPFFESKVTDPHREDLCEGCKIGVCTQGKKRNYGLLF